MKRWFTATWLVISLVLTMDGCSDSTVDKTPTTYVLVHGSFRGPFVWQSVAESLRQQGHPVLVVELPAHGSDSTAPERVTLNSYRDKVIEVMKAVEEPVILVGHSMGGIVISAVAEQIPEQIGKLVYLAGYVPASDQSLLDLAQTDQQSQVLSALVPSADGLTLGIRREDIARLFCQDCPTSAADLLVQQFRPEPAIPASDKVNLSPTNFGRVAKCYVFTADDRSIGPDLQQRMVSTASITEVYTLRSGHTPQLSISDQVSELLLAIQ